MHKRSVAQFEQMTKVSTPVKYRERLACVLTSCQCGSKGRLKFKYITTFLYRLILCLAVYVFVWLSRGKKYKFNGSKCS